MTDTPSILLLLVLGVNHAIHIGDIVVIYTIDKKLNLQQTARLFAFTVVTHVVNVAVVFLLLLLFLSAAPVRVEHLLTEITGGIVLLLGIYFLVWRLRERSRQCTHHAHEYEVKRGSLLGIGALGGFIPCGEVIGIGLLSTSAALFLWNLLWFLGGLATTLGILMVLGSTAGHSLRRLRHSSWIRLVTPFLLIILGLYKILAA